ncbi:hypothetical protein Vretimale_16062 [Volvox reticuliferus]|uniref:Protein kinase domain-containing protein n=2 Tax=Volvox reticuliferus TaxID=1737510 RepID=A0A8J4LVQ6_9CHLO|nr:hypothetical protein Vretimale_16062 [Volvox reticuliferus]
MERSKELSFSVRNSGDAVQPTGMVGSTPGFVGDLQLLAGEELEARLQIHERIGGGSTARVYRGALDGTPVAVKILHPHAAQRESTLQEFLREAQVLARLQNKYIVRLHALAHLPPNFAGLPTRRFTWGIVMEFMEAGPLTKLVEEAAKVYKQQQRIKQQLAIAATQSVGGASSIAPERTQSLRNLRPNLSFLRRRSLTAAADAAAPASPRNRTGSVASGAIPASPSAIADGAAGDGGGGGTSAPRLDSIMHEMPSLPYTDREALQWCMEVALALQFLHAQTPPVVHRDVKTDNVLMSPLLRLPQLSIPLAPGMRQITEATGLRSAATETGAGGPATASGTSFTAAAGGSVVYSSHGSLARRVLSVRAAAALAEEGAPSPQGSLTVFTVRPGGGQPLTAKLCDFGLHVVLDATRPVVTVRRSSYEHTYGADPLAMAGHGVAGSALPYSNSLTRRSTRNSPAGLLTGGTPVILSPSASITAAAGGPMGPPSQLIALHTGGVCAHTHSGLVSGHGLGMGMGGRYEARSRRSSMMYNRPAAEENGLFRRAVSRDGDSFSRTQTGVHRKGSSVSYADSLEHTAPPAIASSGRVLASITSGSGSSTIRGSSLSAAAAGSGGAVTGIFSSSPPKPGPFAGSAAAAVAAAAAALGSSASIMGPVGRLSSGAMAPVVGLRGSGGGGGGGGAFSSPKSSGPGNSPGRPKWSGGNTVTAAMQHANLSSFTAARASLELLLQGRMSATVVGPVASQSGASSHSVMIATGGGGSVAGLTGGGMGGGGGSTTPLLPASHTAAGGGGLESLSAGQMMLQLNAGSATGMLDRVSRLRQSHAGPGTGDLGLGSGIPLESALRIGNRSSSGRPSAATAAALLAAAGSQTGMDTGMYGATGAVGERLVSGTGSGVLRLPRPSGSSPATSSRGGTRLRSNPAQVEKYLAMMEEDLQLDVASRSSSKVQVDMDPLYGPASRAGSQTAAANNPRLLGGGGGGGGGGGSGLGLGQGTPSNRSMLSSGPSHGSILGSSQAGQQQSSSSQHQHQKQSAVLSPTGSSHQVTHSPKASAPTPSGPGGAAPVFGAGRVRPQASGSGSGSGSGATTAAPGTAGRISSVGPNSPSSPNVRVASNTSTRSEQGIIVLTGVSCSGFGDQAGSGGSGHPPAPAAVAGGGGGGAAAAAAAALRGMAILARGPNPMKSSSQPAMSVSSSANAGAYLHAVVPSPGWRPNPMKSSSQPAMSVSGPAATVIGSIAKNKAAVHPPARLTPPLAMNTAQPSMRSGGGSGGGASGGGGSAGGASGGGGSGGGGSGNGAPSAIAAGGCGEVAHSPPRAPNPVKSSSQPTMSVTTMAAMAACASPRPGSSSRPRELNTSNVAPGLVHTTSHGSRAMSHLSMAAASVAVAPCSPTGSVHAMDLSPPVARVRSTRMGQGQLHGTVPAAPAGGSSMAAAATGLDSSYADLLQRESSGSAFSNIGHTAALAARRNRHQLEVTVPVDGAEGSELASSASGSVLPARVLSPPGGSRGGSAGGDGTPSSAAAPAVAAAGRHWVATVTAAASPRTHSPGGSGSTPPIGPQLVTVSSGGADGSILPMPPISHAHNAAGVVLNRELHKVVKRLRPDGGGGCSFVGSGNSPLGLPPTVPVHHGGSGVGAVTGEAGSFSYSRRSSMDSHAPSYQSIGSARSATATFQPASGSGALHGGVGIPGALPTLYREKLLSGRGGLAPGTSSAGQSSAGVVGGALGTGGSGAIGGIGSFGHSGTMLSGALTSDPNSPVSSYGPAAGSNSFLGRAAVGALRHHPMVPMGSLLGPMAGSITATAAASGQTMPRTTSGGVSASGNSGRQSSAGERSGRQSSLVRHSSSTHSWGDYGTTGGAASTAAVVAHVLTGAASGTASPSHANTGGSPRAFGQIGPSGGNTMGTTAVSGPNPSALASPMLTHVKGGGSQGGSTAVSMGPQRVVSDSAASSTLGGWTGRDDMPLQGDPAYALTGRAGTLLYMAPEVIRHEPYNEKVDVFSFGVVLYEVFGRVLLLDLYSKDELEALSSRIAQGFRHSRPDCMPQAIWDLVQQCWAQNPADRPTMPLVVRQMELALEAMDEAEAAVATTHSGTQHRVGSLFVDVGAGVSGTVMPPGSPIRTAPGTGPGSAGTVGKERSSGRSIASCKSLLSLGGSLGRRSKGGLSFRRRGTNPRSPPQPTAPTPGRTPPTPVNPPSQLFQAGVGGAGGSSVDSPRSPSAGGGLQSPMARGSVTTTAASTGPTGRDSVVSNGLRQPRCACVIS